VSPGVRSVEFELCSVASFTRPKVFVFSDLRVSFFDRLNRIFGSCFCGFLPGPRAGGPP